MGKRSDLPRRERDFYRTPPAAVQPLLTHLPESFTYVEPCAGDGALIDILPGTCVMASDIEPQRDDVCRADALTLTALPGVDFCITNPPWTIPILHGIIDHWRHQMPTWLLFYADWMHTKQAAPYLPYCHKIVSIGRVCWFPETKVSGKDNCAWYLFDATPAPEGTIFYGRNDPAQ